MKKFVATPVDQYGHWVVERLNENNMQYERHEPKAEGAYLSEEEANKKADFFNCMYDQDVMN